MRTATLAAALAAGALLAACSKPEPAAGAPTPEVVAVDSTKTTTDTTVTAAMPDSTATDSTMTEMSDSATTPMPDSTVSPDSTK